MAPAGTKLKTKKCTELSQHIHFILQLYYSINSKMWNSLSSDSSEDEPPQQLESAEVPTLAAADPQRSSQQNQIQRSSRSVHLTSDDVARMMVSACRRQGTGEASDDHLCVSTPVQSYAGDPDIASWRIIRCLFTDLQVKVLKQHQGHQTQKLTVASGISLAESTPTRCQGTAEVSEHHLRETIPVSVAGSLCYNSFYAS